MDTVKKAQLLLERGWNDALLADDPMWRRLSFTSREYLHEGQDLVLWEVRDGQPKVLDLLTVTEFGLTAEDGPRLDLTWTEAWRSVRVGVLPQPVAEGVYVWIPAFAGIRYTPRDFKDPHSPRRLTVPMCIRTLHAPHKLSEGAAYLTPLAQFRKSYPELG